MIIPAIADVLVINDKKTINRVWNGTVGVRPIKTPIAVPPARA
jgi:hypothetical protein